MADMQQQAATNTERVVTLEQQMTAMRTEVVCMVEAQGARLIVREEVSP